MDIVTRTTKEFKDYSKTGRVRPWKDMKYNNKVLQCVYTDLYQNFDSYLENSKINPYLAPVERYRDIAYRLSTCATYLNYDVVKVDDKVRYRLKDAKFCRVRLCPMCIWRRSLKTSVQLSKVLNYEKTKKPWAYIFLTLTVPNVKTEELSETLTKMHVAFSKYFVKNKKIKKSVTGWFRSTEVTYNKERDDWHPHFHCLLQVNTKFFKSPELYIKQKEWKQIWINAIKDERIKMVNVKRVKPKEDESLIHAVCEVAKYSVKATDYIDTSDMDWSAEQVAKLDKILFKRRFAGWGGNFKQARKDLELDDVENGDLTNLGESTNEEVLADLYVGWLENLKIYSPIQLTIRTQQ